MASGTAICGGTAIATLAPLIGARADQVGVAIGIVFLLNAAALFGFPLIGHWLGMTQLQFGMWTALAIHDTSSVLATSAIYGNEALEIATTVKLGRTLWLIPLTLIVSLAQRASAARVRVPPFIVAFIAVSVLTTVRAVARRHRSCGGPCQQGAAGHRPLLHRDGNQLGHAAADARSGAGSRAAAVGHCRLGDPRGGADGVLTGIWIGEIVPSRFPHGCRQSQPMTIRSTKIDLLTIAAMAFFAAYVAVGLFA